MSGISPHQYADREGTANSRARTVLVCVFILAAGIFGWAGNRTTLDYDIAAETQPVAVTGRTASETRIVAHSAEPRGRFALRFTELSSPLQSSSSESISALIPIVASHLSELGDAKFENSDYDQVFNDLLTTIGANIRGLESSSNNQLGPELGLETQIEQSIERGAKRREELASQTSDTAKVKIESEHETELREANLRHRDLQDKVATLRAQLADAIGDGKEEQVKAARDAALQQDMASIRAYLSPFITPGYVQPSVRAISGTIEHTVEKIPVSIVRLERLGALEPTIKGLHELYRFGSSNNDRPRGSFPRYGWEGDINNANNRASVQKAQELILRHKQALLDAHLLSQ